MKLEKKGFTLIEIIVVIATLAIIAAVAVPTAFGSIEKARTAACDASTSNIQSALRLEKSDDLLNNNARVAKAAIETALTNSGIDLTAHPLEDYASKPADAVAAYKIGGICQSGGEYVIIVYEGESEQFTYTINCTKHDDPDAGSIVDFLSDSSKLKEYYNNANRIYSGTSLDNTGKNFGKPILEALRKQFPAMSINTFKIDIKSDKDGEKYDAFIKRTLSSTEHYNVYLSSNDISTYNSSLIGTLISVTKYDYFTNQYVTGTVKLTKGSDTAQGNYLVMDTSTFVAD